jgi:hypothetical protein
MILNTWKQFKLWTDIQTYTQCMYLTNKHSPTFVGLILCGLISFALPPSSSYVSSAVFLPLFGLLSSPWLSSFFSSAVFFLHEGATPEGLLSYSRPAVFFLLFFLIGATPYGSLLRSSSFFSSVVFFLLLGHSAVFISSPWKKTGRLGTWL